MAIGFSICILTYKVCYKDNEKDTNIRKSNGKAKCPVCGSNWFDPLYSMNKMYCYECDDFRPFYLKEGQKSLLIKGLIGKKQ